MIHESPNSNMKECVSIALLINCTLLKCEQMWQQRWKNTFYIFLKGVYMGGMILWLYWLWAKRLDITPVILILWVIQVDILTLSTCILNVTNEYNVQQTFKYDENYLILGIFRIKWYYVCKLSSWVIPPS